MMTSITNNKEQQIKNSIIYLLPLIIGNALPIITVPVFTRILSPQDYGVLALATIYATVVKGLANFGMPVVYDRNYYQYRDDHKKAAQLLYSILLFVILNFIILAGITYVFRDALAKLVVGSGIYGDLLFWTTCAFFLNTSSWFYLTYYKNSELPKEFVAYSIASSFIHFVVSIYFVVILRIGVIGIVYAQLCSGIVIFCVLTYKFFSALPVALSRERLGDAMQIAYPLTPRILLGVASTQSDNYIVGMLDSVGGAGIYNIGKKISNLIFAIMTAIENVFSPQMYRKMFDLREKGGYAVGRYLTPFVYVSIFVALLMSLFSEEVISILTPASYHGAIDVVSVLSMYYGLLFIGKITGPQLIFMKKTYISSLLTIFNLVIFVSISILFILKWGMMGAAWATVLSGIISTVISLNIAQRHYKIHWEFNKVAGIYLVFFISALLLILLRGMDFDYHIRLLSKTISISFYAYIGVRIKVLTTDNFNIVKQMLLAKLAQ